MAINLKEILISDSDSIKLDKVNYNFDQLLAAGGGPKGPQGEKGDAGLQGITGQKGEIGPQGNQGPVGLKGDSGAELWYGVAGQFNNSVVSVHDPNDYPEPSNVLIGFNYQDAPYNSPNSDTSLLVNRSSYYGSNLRLSSSTVPGFFVDYTVEEANGIKKFKTISSNVAGSKFEWSAGEYNFYDYSTSNLLLSIAANNITTSIDSFFNEPATFNSSLTYNFGTPATGKVVASADSSGLFEWKYPDELGGVAPIGTIVGVLYDKWNDSNNFLGTSTPEVYDIDDDEILPILAGRGVGDYAGWYICNGQTWRNASNSFSYTVPDLNSFSYTIDDNSDSTDPNSQGAASGSNNNLNLLGGIDLEMQATYDSNTGDYTIGMTQSTADDTIYAGTSGTSYVIKRVPQIIYLGETDLYWTAGSGQVSPPHGVTYTFEDTDNVIPDVTLPPVIASAGATTSLNGGNMFTIPTVSNPGWAFTTQATFTGWPVSAPNITQYISSDDTQLELQIAGLTHPANTVTNATIQYSSVAAGYAEIPQTTYKINLIPIGTEGTGPSYMYLPDISYPAGGGVEAGTAEFTAGETYGSDPLIGLSSYTFVYQNSSPPDLEFSIDFDTDTSVISREFRTNQSNRWIETRTHAWDGSTAGSQFGDWYWSDGSGNSSNGPTVGSQQQNFSTCKARGHIRIDSSDLPTDGGTHEVWVNMFVSTQQASVCGVSLYGPSAMGYHATDSSEACMQANGGITVDYYRDTYTPFYTGGEHWYLDPVQGTWSVPQAGWYSTGGQARYWDGYTQVGHVGWTGNSSITCPHPSSTMLAWTSRNDGVVQGYGGTSYSEFTPLSTPTAYTNGNEPRRQPGYASSGLHYSWSGFNNGGTWTGMLENGDANNDAKIVLIPTSINGPGGYTTTQNTFDWSYVSSNGQMWSGTSGSLYQTGESWNITSNSLILFSGQSATITITRVGTNIQNLRIFRDDGYYNGLQLSGSTAYCIP